MSVSQRKVNIMWYHLYGELKKKNDTNELIYKSDSQTQKTNFQLPKGKGGGKG